MKIDSHEIEITNPDKVLFPRDGITKGNLIEYYRNIASWMLPYMRNRCLTMLRFPNGIGHEGFYQKDAGTYFPGWIKLQPVEKSDKSITNYVVGNNAATLVYLANQAVVTPHLWLSTINKINFPDRMIFDLDPANDRQFDLVKKTAIILKDILDKLGLTSYLMLTGSRGMHVVVPLDQSLDYDAVRAFSHKVAQLVEQTDPKNYTLNPRKESRGKKLLIDYLRNGFGATAVAPYAVRHKDGAPVATPLHWDEIHEKSLKSQKYTIHTIFKRLKTEGNVWQGFFNIKQSLN